MNFKFIELLTQLKTEILVNPKKLFTPLHQAVTDFAELTNLILRYCLLGALSWSRLKLSLKRPIIYTQAIP